MQRIKAVGDHDVPEGSKAILVAVIKKQGAVTNFIKTLARSPAALRFYLSQTEALSTGVLSKQLREQIALVAAGANNCDYCASVHTFLGKRTGLDAVELAANIAGHSADPKTRAVLRFVDDIVKNQGHLADLDLSAIRKAGYGDEQIVEIIAHVEIFSRTTSTILRKLQSIFHLCPRRAHYLLKEIRVADKRACPSDNE